MPRFEHVLLLTVAALAILLTVLAAATAVWPIAVMALFIAILLVVRASRP